MLDGATAYPPPTRSSTRIPRFEAAGEPTEVASHDCLAHFERFARTTSRYRRLTVIRGQELTIEIAERVLVDDASFSVYAGDKVGLVGRNGAGKTTLLRTLGGERPPTSGRSPSPARSASCPRTRAPIATGPKTSPWPTCCRPAASTPSATSSRCSAATWKTTRASGRSGASRTPRRRSATPAATAPSPTCTGSSPVSASPPTAPCSRSPRSPVASGAGSSSRASCSAAPRTWCSTSPPTTSTSTPRSG